VKNNYIKILENKKGVSFHKALLYAGRKKLIHKRESSLTVLFLPVK
jgi:hypothetical protein